ncbi:hypothetical protein DY245_06345 [Streptomyces inhibens]|uniref:Uncharacterized protein n=1 Tax=Streptomyces inhibens TaxID=2293571 RepID=A0A371Q8U3_STRIH|nr:hypothetical protein DY245_06345 [Streptomyces inhibens]
MVMVDQTPGTYKPIGKVMGKRRGLAQAVATLKQVICGKVREAASQPILECVSRTNFQVG